LSRRQEEGLLYLVVCRNQSKCEPNQKVTNISRLCAVTTITLTITRRGSAEVYGG
jgi:hypothetical protein